MVRLLRDGVPKVRIAQRVGIDRSTVDRIAAHHGFPARARQPNGRDWKAIRAYYEKGHSAAECMRRYGFTDATWDAAVARGEIVPRSRSQQPPGETRRKVEQLLNEGIGVAQISKRLGISKPTVCYHVRRLGIPPDLRFAKRVDWAAVQKAHDEGTSVRACARRFGFHKGSWHKAVQRGDIRPRSHLIPLDELLVRGRPTNRSHLKQRLIAAGLKQARCEECGIADWLDMPLSLHVHHKNGDGTDNRLENLQVLCPNCHSQTDTYGGRNGHRRPERHLELVEPLPEEDSEEPTGT